MKILAIDSSTKRFSLAVCDGEDILKGRNIVLRKVLSSSIIPAIGKVLKDAGLSLSDIDGFAVGLGPGSFTSLRVGIATVKAFCFALGKPVVGIPSPDVIAENIDARHRKAWKRVCVLSDARRGLVYAAVYRVSRARLRREGGYRLSQVEDVLKGINSDTLFVGDAAALYREKIEAFLRDSCQAGWRAGFVPEKFAWPDARRLLPLARQRFGQGKTIEADRIVPLYLYPADCQVVKR